MIDGVIFFQNFLVFPYINKSISKLFLSKLDRFFSVIAAVLSAVILAV